MCSSRGRSRTLRLVSMVSSLLRGRSLSIVARLSLFYGALTLVLLSVSSASLYWTLSRELTRDDTKLLDDQVRALRKVIGRISQLTPDVGLEENWTEWALIDPRFQTRILDAGSGAVVAVSPGMQVPQEAFLPVAGKVPLTLGWSTRSDERFVLLSASVASADKARPAAFVQLALDKSEDDRLLQHYRERLFVVLLLGGFTGSALGATLARRSLRPLKHMSEVASRFTASRLHERINPDLWPSELKLLAGTLDAMLSRLEESFTRLHAFSADLAHELRTPVHNLIGETEVALDRPRPPAEYRSLLESNLEEFGRLTRMIDSMLFIARADNDDIRIEAVWFDAIHELKYLREFFDAMAEEKGVTVRCEGQAPAWGDPVLFRRAVGNLLSNAMRFSPSGATVVLSAAATDGGGTRVLVSDEGSGIAAEDTERVFDRFYRSDPSRRHAESGAGLGLAIVKSIMELHRGSVSIVSTGPQGTSFELLFPPQAGTRTDHFSVGARSRS